MELPEIWRVYPARKCQRNTVKYRYRFDFNFILVRSAIMIEVMNGGSKYPTMNHDTCGSSENLIVPTYAQAQT